MLLTKKASGWLPAPRDGNRKERETGKTAVNAGSAPHGQSRAKVPSLRTEHRPPIVPLS